MASVYTSNGSQARLAVLEEQRAALYKELHTNPNNPNVKQALSRLVTPQHIKQAAGSGIFISYSRADELFAVELAEDMMAAQLPVWLDTNEITDAGDWKGEVVKALNRCGLMVTILSANALEDDDAMAEQRYFMDMGKVIIPVIYQHMRREGINFWMQPIDFRHDYSLGLNTLTRLLRS